MKSDFKYFSLNLSEEGGEELFRTLSKQYHPDKNSNPSAALIFSEIKSEYEEFKSIKAHWNDLSEYFGQYYYNKWNIPALNSYLNNQKTEANKFEITPELIQVSAESLSNVLDSTKTIFKTARAITKDIKAIRKSKNN